MQCLAFPLTKSNTPKNSEEFTKRFIPELYSPALQVYGVVDVCRVEAWGVCNLYYPILSIEMTMHTTMNDDDVAYIYVIKLYHVILLF